MRTTAAFMVVLVGLSACSGVSETATRECTGADTDLTQEPDYPVDYMHRATRASCPVRLDVLTLTRPGAEFHCAPWPPSIVMGTPLGALTTQHPRIYVRDPGGVFDDPELTAGFDGDATLPSAARQSPYRLDGADLWTVEDGRFIYLRYHDRTERWPLDTTPHGCA